MEEIHIGHGVFFPLTKFFKRRGAEVLVFSSKKMTWDADSDIVIDLYNRYKKYKEILNR